MCVRWRRVCEAKSCVRRARHVIQRNPPPETRASEGDGIGYKASGNICPKTSARSSSGPLAFFYLLGFIIYHYSRVHASVICTWSECDPTTIIILELTSTHRYSGWVQLSFPSFLIFLFAFFVSLHARNSIYYSPQDGPTCYFTSWCVSNQPLNIWPFLLCAVAAELCIWVFTEHRDGHHWQPGWLYWGRRCHWCEVWT